jgi:hypothetical protein
VHDLEALKARSRADRHSGRAFALGGVADREHDRGDALLWGAEEIDIDLPRA